MVMANQSMITEFILLGFPGPRGLQIFFFLLLLLIYVLTLSGNTAIVFVVWSDHRFHTPMYFFLSNLAFLDIFFTSAVIPKLLAIFIGSSQTISVVACFGQSFVYFFLGTTEFFLLAAMSFDRYVAICNPLRYSSVMSGRVCLMLALACWLGSCLFLVTPTLLVCWLPFCGPNVIDHFFCENAILLKLACADTFFIEMLGVAISAVVVLGSLVFTLISYFYIIGAIMKIPSSVGRQKAFSTCTSHLIVVTIYYGSCIFMYVKPSQGSSLNIKKGVSILPSMVTPLLNPFIYSLRNEKVKEVLRDIICRGDHMPNGKLALKS